MKSTYLTKNILNLCESIGYDCSEYISIDDQTEDEIIDMIFHNWTIIGKNFKPN